MSEGTPPGDALPPPPQRATPARKGARCGTGAGSPRPHRPHPGHTGRGTLAARSRRQAAGEGTAPDTRPPSQRSQAPPPGTPFSHPHSQQRRPARAHAVGPVLGRRARTDRTRDTRVAEPRLPAPEDGRPGEGQRLTPGAPRNGVRPPPRARPPTTPAARSPHRACRPRGQRWAPTPTHPRPQYVGGGPQRPPSGRAVGGGTAPDLRRPSQWCKAPPPGTPFRHPQSEQRRPTRAHAVGPVLGPHACTDRTRGTRVAEPWLPAPEDGRPGEGQRLTPDAPHNGGRPPPPGTAPHHPRGTQPPQGMKARGTVLGPHSHTPAPTARGWRTPTACPMGGQSGEGQRLTSDAPHTMVEGTPPRGRRPTTPTASNAGLQGRTLWGRCWVPTPASTEPGTHGSRNPGYPLQRTGGRRRDGAQHQTPLPMMECTPPGDALPPTLPRATHQRTNAPATGHPHPTPTS